MFIVSPGSRLVSLSNHMELSIGIGKRLGSAWQKYWSGQHGEPEGNIQKEVEQDFEMLDDGTDHEFIEEGEIV